MMWWLWMMMKALDGKKTQHMTPSVMPPERQRTSCPIGREAQRCQPLHGMYGGGNRPLAGWGLGAFLKVGLYAVP